MPFAPPCLQPATIPPTTSLRWLLWFFKVFFHVPYLSLLSFSSINFFELTLLILLPPPATHTAPSTRQDFLLSDLMEHLAPTPAMPPSLHLTCHQPVISTSPYPIKVTITSHFTIVSNLKQIPSLPHHTFNTSLFHHTTPNHILLQHIFTTIHHTTPFSTHGEQRCREFEASYA